MRSLGETFRRLIGIPAPTNSLEALVGRLPAPPARPALDYTQEDDYGCKPNLHWLGVEAEHQGTRARYTITGFRWVETNDVDYWAVEYVETERLTRDMVLFAEGTGPADYRLRVLALDDPRHALANMLQRGPGYARPLAEFANRPDGTPRFLFMGVEVKDE